WRQKLSMGSQAGTNFEHVPIGKLLERDKRLERDVLPRHIFVGTCKKSGIELFKVSFCAHRRREGFAPIVAHRRRLPPRPVDGLPIASLRLVAGELRGPLESSRFVFEFGTRKIFRNRFNHTPVSWAERQ